MLFVIIEFEGHLLHSKGTFGLYLAIRVYLWQFVYILGLTHNEKNLYSVTGNKMLPINVLFPLDWKWIFQLTAV